MSFYKDITFDEPQEMEANQGNYTARGGPSKPTRYFNWKSTKDRNYTGERHTPTGYRGNATGSSRKINKNNSFNRNGTHNYWSNSNFNQYPVEQPAANVAMDQDNTNQDIGTSQGFSHNKSISDMDVNSASTSKSNLITGELAGNNVTKARRSGKKIKKKDMVKLNYLSVRKLVSQEGVDFLQKLSDETKVKIKVIPRGQTKKFEYACTVEGKKQAKSKVKESIKSYCRCLLKDPKLEEAEPFQLMDAFQGKEFDMNVLQENLSNLENPNVNWLKLTVALHKRVKGSWGKFNAASRNGQLDKRKECENLLKRQYIALHAVLLGKVGTADGPMHLEVLKLALKNGLGKESDVEAVRNSYNYIFRSSVRLPVVYLAEITKLPPHTGLKTEIDDLFNSGVSICEKNNMKEELSKLKSAYNNLLHCHYSERKLFQFRKVYDGIKDNS